MRSPIFLLEVPRQPISEYSSKEPERPSTLVEKAGMEKKMETPLLLNKAYLGGSIGICSSIALKQ